MKRLIIIALIIAFAGIASAEFMRTDVVRALRADRASIVVDRSAQTVTYTIPLYSTETGEQIGSDVVTMTLDQLKSDLAEYEAKVLEIKRYILAIEGN